MTFRDKVRRWWEDHRLVTFKYLVERTNAAREDERRRLESRHREELAKRTKKIESVLEKIAKTQWRHDDGLGYAVTIRLNPNVFGGISPFRDDMRFVAQMIGRQVEAEIGSGYYIVDARQDAHRRYTRVQ